MKRTVRTNWKGPPRANAVKLGTILYDTVNGSNSGVSRKTRPPTLCGPSLAKAGARMNGRDKLRRSTGPNDKSLVGSSLGSAPRRRRERERERGENATATASRFSRKQCVRIGVPIRDRRRRRRRRRGPQGHPWGCRKIVRVIQTTPMIESPDSIFFCLFCFVLFLFFFIVFSRLSKHVPESPSVQPFRSPAVLIT